MAKETYKVARERLLAELGKAGWTIRPWLKVPWAEPRGGGFKLFFKTQAVYMDEHSMWMDIRSMPFSEFLERVERARVVRSDPSFHAF